MNEHNLGNLYANFDALSRRGMFSRGAPVYRGASMTPNPLGMNQWTANPKFDPKALERRMGNGRYP
jgi:hypothetical protein